MMRLGLGVWECMSILVIARSLSVMCAPIMDCDETFNYWEPLHYLLFGRGFQTWEYSPVFALRTYAYVAIHAVLGAPQLLYHGTQSGSLQNSRLGSLPETEKVLLY